MSEQERPWQPKIVQDILDAYLRKNKKVVCLLAPTGSGKTLIALRTAVRLDCPAFFTTRTLNQYQAYTGDFRKFSQGTTYTHLLGRAQCCPFGSNSSLICRQCLHEPVSAGDEEEEDNGGVEYPFQPSQRKPRRYIDAEKIASLIQAETTIDELKDRYCKRKQEEDICLYYSLREIPTKNIIMTYSWAFLHAEIVKLRGTSIAELLSRSLLVVDEAHNLDGMVGKKKDLSLSKVRQAVDSIDLKGKWRERFIDTVNIRDLEASMTVLAEIIQRFIRINQDEDEEQNLSHLRSLLEEQKPFIDRIKLANALLAKFEIELTRGKATRIPGNPFGGICSFIKIIENGNEEYTLFSSRTGLFLIRSDPAPIISRVVAASKYVLLMSGTMPNREYISKVWDIQNEDIEEIDLEGRYPSDYYSIFPKTNRKFFLDKTVTSLKDLRDDDMYDKYARRIEKAFAETPKNMIVCATSYAMMEQLYRRVKAPKIMERKNKNHTGDDPDEVTHDGIRQDMISGGKMILFAVARATFLEGVEFTHNGESLVSAIYIAGMPIPNTHGAVYIARKRAIQRRIGTDNEQFFFIHQPALIATKQAAGRGIRFPNDKVAVYLGDDRFGKGDFWKKNLGEMEVWI